MPADPRPPRSAAPPAADRLEALDSDQWAALLPHVRTVLRRLEASETSSVLARLRDAPTSRLVGGRLRRQLCRALAADDGGLWSGVAAEVGRLQPVPDALRWVVDEDAGDVGREAAVPGGQQGPTDEGGDAEEGDRSAARLRDRLRRAREERDRWRRRAEGEQARAEALARELQELRHELSTRQRELERARHELHDAAEQRRRAVDRERRRRERELAELREELTARRRAEEERRARRRDEDRRPSRPARDGGSTTPVGAPAAARLVPGRPSRLPEGVAPDTTEAADVLLHRGRLVLVDGYNLTKQHRGQLDLEGQRAWLVGVLAAAAARRGIRPVVVFDGERAGGGRPQGSRQVSVRFTAAGITADDELVLAVEGTDEPVVVVTDDRELRARVVVAGADVVGTRAFLGAVS